MSPDGLINEWLDHSRGRRPYMVYCIQCGPYFKVGIAEDIKKRMQTFAVSNPFKMKLVFYRKVEARHVRFIESEIHKALAVWHHRGEWFTAPVLEIKTAARRAIAKIPQRNAEYRQHAENVARAIEVEKTKQKTKAAQKQRVAPRG